MSCKATYGTYQWEGLQKHSIPFRKQLSSEGSGVQTRAENMLDLVPPPGTISHLTRDIQKVSNPKSSFARPWKWKDNLVGSRL